MRERDKVGGSGRGNSGEAVMEEWRIWLDVVGGVRGVCEGEMPQAGIGRAGSSEDTLGVEPDVDVFGSEGDFAT